MFTVSYRISPSMTRTLDMSRWIAAGLVVLYHIRLNVLVDGVASNRLIRLVNAIGDCGPQAVIWFFVISGFLVGGKVLADIQQDRFDFKRYAINRVSRLYIVLIPALLIGYGTDLLRVDLYGINSGAGSETLASYGLWSFFVNLFCLQTIYAPMLGSNVPLWSLACEAWYYVLFPLLVLPFVPLRPTKMRVVYALIAISIIGMLMQHPRILQLFVFWLMGIVVWICPRPMVLLRSRVVAWSIAVVCILNYPTLEMHLKIIAALSVGLSFTNVLLVSMHAKVVPGVASRGRLHALLAGFSYSLYLTHAPLIHFALTLAKNQGDPRLALQPGWTAGAWGLGLLMLASGYAWLFSLFTEAQTNRTRSILTAVLGRPALKAS